VEKIEAVHSCGYLFNDLKPNNILIGNSDGKNLHKVRLIDFGISKKYMREDGKHIEQKDEQFFKGNFIFASVNAFNFRSLSRRDDLISLTYLLVYMIDGTLPFIIDLGNPRTPEIRRLEFNQTKEIKNKITAEELCASKKAKEVLPFVEQIFALGFKDEPDYAKLKFCLVKVLLEND
jgi:serine/threonine protein kinase